MNKFIEQADYWLAQKWDDFKFWITHDHEWKCTDEPVPHLTSSERFYWHIDKCMHKRCQKRAQVMNGLCNGEDYGKRGWL